MKYCVRRASFETNSSSMHSIIVTKNDIHVDENILWDRNKENDFDTVYIRNGEWNLGRVEDYGRHPFEILTTFEEKTKYALCEYLGHLYPDDPEYDKILNEFKEIVRDIFPEFKDFYFYTQDEDIYVDSEGNHIMRKDLHYDYWNDKENRCEYYYVDKEGNKHPAILDEEDYMEVFDIGSIDHQSAGLLKNFLKDRGISLKEFLTNKKYTICIDGDEYCDLERYLKSGFIDRNFIKEIYSGRSDEDLKYEKWREENDFDDTE